jgi:purine-binding chemotaxis protein CheW
MESATNGNSADYNRAAAGGRFATFYVDKLLLGVAVANVQEVLRPQMLTRVPLASPAIRGLMNLRGQIVTALDMRQRLNLPERTAETSLMNIVVRSDDESVSLLVDEIGDVIDVDSNSFERSPKNLDTSVKNLIDGVFKLKDQLLLILDTHSVVALGD